jgi:hypothetical protein
LVIQATVAPKLRTGKTVAAPCVHADAGSRLKRREGSMGFFTSKATRIAQHRELLSLAKGALQSLRVEAYKSTDGIHVPLWTDPSIVPLECRWWLFTYLESLVTLVYDTDEADLGRRDLLDE